MKLNASWNADTWDRFSNCLARSGGTNLRSPRTLVLAAHPDDETIGASVPLSSFPDSWVVFLTDGAPRDLSLRSSHWDLTREAYAHMRSLESHKALACAGISADRITSFNCVDQESIYNVARLVDRLLSRLSELRPEIVVIHPYEGGHPDHDAAALISSLAMEALQERASINYREGLPLFVEMSSYHAVDEQLRTGEFLCDSSPLLVLELTAEQRERKHRMLSSYSSQATVLQGFKTDREVFRPAPVYDFNAAPHQGKLWYECLDWEMTGQQWRFLAGNAIARFDQHVCR